MIVLRFLNTWISFCFLLFRKFTILFLNKTQQKNNWHHSWIHLLRWSVLLQHVMAWSRHSKADPESLSHYSIIIQTVTWSYTTPWFTLQCLLNWRRKNTRGKFRTPATSKAECFDTIRNNWKCRHLKLIKILRNNSLTTV